MKETPNIARIAALIGDPSRANMVSALMAGKALTARELATEAGILAQTATSHLQQLEAGGIVTRLRSGRHHYFSIASAEAAYLLESLEVSAAQIDQLRNRTGPRDAQMREARVCYDHFAGRHAVALFRHLGQRGDVAQTDNGFQVTPQGQAFLLSRGIEISERNLHCRACMDWSERQYHLAGKAGSAVLEFILAQGWAKRVTQSRSLVVTDQSMAKFYAHFGITP
jgi:DNA-binding transcriptional ArsR family regulator